MQEADVCPITKEIAEGERVELIIEKSALSLVFHWEYRGFTSCCSVPVDQEETWKGMELDLQDGQEGSKHLVFLWFETSTSGNLSDQA